MIVFVDERQTVISNYTALFAQEGVCITGLSGSDCKEWVTSASETDLEAVEAFLLGDCNNCAELSKNIRRRSSLPVLAVSDGHSLERILELFRIGMDDVVRKPVHAREILARVAAICRRMHKEVDSRQTVFQAGPIEVFNDGRDPQINGQELLLPRRERRILEYLVSNREKRVDKTQIFNAIYGIFNADVEESVVESHISKLRKKLKDQLGYDVIDSKRFLGYKLILRD